MPNLIFRGAFIRNFDFRQEEGGAFVRIHATANFSKPVREAMDWDDLPANFRSSKLEGRLAATNLILTPNGDLKQHEVQFAVTEVGDFEAVRVKDGESKSIELRFVIRTAEESVEAVLGNYLRRVGQGEGQMKLSYTKQEDLELKEAPAIDERRQLATSGVAE